MAGRPLEAVAATGLSQDDVLARRRQYGSNRLPAASRVPAWRRLLAQLVHFFALMLWVASALAVLAGMSQLGVAIAVVVLVNGMFAFAQEYRADRSAERLRHLLPRHVTVIRDATRQRVDASDLVPGDLVMVDAGDRIAADLHLLEAHGLLIDSSTLTGESVPASPAAGDMLLAGTFAVEGQGLAAVTAIGAGTRLARIAHLSTSHERPRTPLMLELNHVVRVVAITSLSVGVVFLVIAILVGIRLADGFFFALGVTVALVPEGLLPTISLSLALGAQRMAARGALVRRLESVETLGSTTFICTDKTGTLTRNEMVVAKVWTPAGAASIAGSGYDPAGRVDAEPRVRPRLSELAVAAALHARGRAELREGRWTAVGNPLDAALVTFARRLRIDIDAEEAAAPVRTVFPFDPRRRRMSMVAGGRIVVRGAPEAVLDRCLDASGAADAVAQLTRRGLRVIAVAARGLSDSGHPASPDDAEAGLTLLGLIGVEDPPRDGVAGAIAACRRAGIRVAMVTGDHPDTARAVGEQVGLCTPGSVFFEGKDLPADEQVLGAMLDKDGAVVSRVAPEDKLRIARALRLRGHVVAMTGDGVNDAPALHEAAIGVAMGRSGTDVAREAADLVLLDDNFATIVAAVEQGRTTFANARRFLTYHLTDNVAELMPFVVWALSGGRFPLALGVLQVLCLDIGTDLLPAVALGAEPSSPRALARAPAGRRLIDGPLLVRSLFVLGLTEAAIEMSAFLGTLRGAGWHVGEPFPIGAALRPASGAAFTAVVLGQIANAFACRSATLWPGRLGWFSNRYLILAVAGEILLLAAFLYIDPLATTLGQHAPPFIGFLIALLAFPAVLIADAVHKFIARRRRHAAAGTKGMPR